MIAAPGRMNRFRKVHFVGIGGVGMSGIAEVMLNMGYEVSGSDLSADAGAVRRLRELGARIEQGHAAEHLGDAQVVVSSSAIPKANPELRLAREKRLPIVPRAEMLGELMRFKQGIAVAGTHGKTTTTSLLASLLAEGGLDPTFVIGGMLTSVGANARLGEGDYLVAEADESDGSFLKLKPTIAVVTNIDRDHMETYGGDSDRLQQAFCDFLMQLPFYGLAVVCQDDPGSRELGKSTTRTIMRYGLDPVSDVYAGNVRQEELAMRFDIYFTDGAVLPVRLNLPGLHNVRNALAACTVARELGVDDDTIVRALGEFQGIGRRFNYHGEQAYQGRQFAVVEDYGHHPTEIAATIDAANGAWPERRLVVVFQPHRYTRTHDLLDDFARVLNDADVLVVSEVYSAGEDPIPNADGRALCRVVRARGKLDPIFVEGPGDVAAVLRDVTHDGDVVLFLGAGDIGKTARQIAIEGIEEAGDD